MGQRAAEIEKIIKGVKQFKKEAKRKFGIDKVIIFGSAVRGTMNKHSDIDLILISKKFAKKDFVKRPLGLWRIWRLEYPPEFICYSPKEFEREKKKVSIVKEALEDGIEV